MFLTVAFIVPRYINVVMILFLYAVAKLRRHYGQFSFLIPKHFEALGGCNRHVTVMINERLLLSMYVLLAFPPVMAFMKWPVQLSTYLSLEGMRLVFCS